MATLSYTDVQACTRFRDDFSKMYTSNAFAFNGTPYVQIYELLGDFEYSIQSGVLDDSSSPEYEKCINTLRKMAYSIGKAINSNIKIVDTGVWSKMLAVYDIMILKLANH